MVDGIAALAATPSTAQFVNDAAAIDAASLKNLYKVLVAAFKLLLFMSKSLKALWFG